VATVVVWVVLVAALIASWTRFGAAADNSFTGSDPGQTLLDEHFPSQSGDSLTLAIRSDAPVTAAAVESRVRTTLATYADAADVTGVTDPFTTPGHVSTDGHIAYATVQFRVQGSSIPGGEVTTLMDDATKASGGGVTFSLGGDVVDSAETPYGGPDNGIGVGAAMVVLLVAFGSLLAMGLPVATALFGIGAGLSLIALLGHVFPAPSFSPIVAAMIGLGVGADYAMFILTRFRTELGPGSPGREVRGAPGQAECPPGLTRRAELADGKHPEEAAVAAIRTAGTSVLTAGGVVVIGMLGLLILRQQLLNGVAIAAAATVAMTVLAALTLLPALLGFSGTRLARPTLPSRLRYRVRRRPGNGQPGDGQPGDGESARIAGGATVRSGAWERWAGVIQRHRIVAALASVAIVLVLALPALAMKLSMPDESAQARGTMGYASYATMAQGFGPGFDAPLIVAAQLPGHAAAGATSGLEEALKRVPGIAAVTPPVISRDRQAAMIIAYPTTGAQDAATNALANRIRGTVLPASGLRAYLTGPNAANVAFANLIGQRLPLLVATVIVLSMAVLLIVFRSVVIPVKAALMNLLSVTAAYGVLTAITQWGWGGRFFGFPEKMPVTTWVPVFLFVILFGLSMDYEVFLLSRIRERYAETGDNSKSVAQGLAATGRVISAAAAIMVVVFCSFLATPDVSVKQIGLGLAVAVLIDATLVRLVLVPALMEMLGRANWWLPKRLAKVSREPLLGGL
jgi:RND superfamily putative drug exporter